MVEDAVSTIPMVVVGWSVPDTTFQSLNAELMKSTPAIAATTPPVPLVFKSDEVMDEIARFVLVEFVMMPLVMMPLVAKKFVLVAFVVVPKFTVKRSIVDDE